MKRLRLFQWAAALTLAFALAPGAASAQEDDTLTVCGSFSMDYLGGDVDLYAPDLFAVYSNGHEHTWALTLHGTTHSHYDNAKDFNLDWPELYYQTIIHATSFDLEFFGPDAATLNSFVSDHLAGGNVTISLGNEYISEWADMYVSVGAGSFYFDTVLYGSDTLFPTDADGFYPVVGPEPISIETSHTALGREDWISGSFWHIASQGGLVTFEGSIGEPPLPSLPTLSIQDGSLLEGKRGTTNLNLSVTLSASSTNTVTVNYATDDGTATAGSDYVSAIGTLTFQPGQTSKTISISVKGDRKKESNETLHVDLSEAVGATIANGTATGTILNDD